MCCIYQIKMYMLGFQLLPTIRLLDGSRGHINQLKILRKILILIPNEVSSVMSELMSASRRKNIHEAVEVIIGYLQHLHYTLYSGSSLDRDAVRLPACISHTCTGSLPPPWLPAVSTVSCLPHSLSSTFTRYVFHIRPDVHQDQVCLHVVLQW